MTCDHDSVSTSYIAKPQNPSIYISTEEPSIFKVHIQVTDMQLSFQCLLLNVQ